MKIPCLRCGALIMPETAARTGGMCMPCKSGTRANMDASIAAAKAERERDASDPFRLCWRKLVHTVHGTPSGLSRLSDMELQYWAVGCLSGEVYNGGFDQYFHNSAGASYLAALAGLQSMEASASLLLLQKAKQMIFGFHDVPEDTSCRRRILASVESDSLRKRLDDLDAQFWADPDRLAARSEAFALRHRLVQADAP